MSFLLSVQRASWQKMSKRDRPKPWKFYLHPDLDGLAADNLRKYAIRLGYLVRIYMVTNIPDYADGGKGVSTPYVEWKLRDELPLGDPLRDG